MDSSSTSSPVMMPIDDNPSSEKMERIGMVVIEDRNDVMKSMYLK